MALFNKLFFNKRKLVNKQSNTHHSHNTSSGHFSFNKEQVRILLFRECDWRGRRLLFDSSGMEKLSQCQRNYEQSESSSTDNNNYKCGKPSSDYKEIGEMVFGSVAVSFCGTSLKVHWLNKPSRLLCSQVFFAPVQFYQSNASSYSATSSSSRFSTCLSPEILNDVNSSTSETLSMNSVTMSDSMITSSKIIDIEIPVALSLDNDEFKFISQMSQEDSSGYSSEPLQIRNMTSARSSLSSIFSDIGYSGRKMSVESNYENNLSDYGRFNRRVLKNLSTSFENVPYMMNRNSSIPSPNFHENLYYTVTGASNTNNDSRRNSEIFPRRKAASGGDVHNFQNNCRNTNKRTRLAIAITITMSECMEQEMICFCSEHMVLLESMLYRLKFAAEQAYVHRQKNLFNLIMIKAWLNTSKWLTDFFSMPRLTVPVWICLSLSSENAPAHHKSLPNETVFGFINDLLYLLDFADTKDTNFFLTSLITAVLTYHLGWVSTVSPFLKSSNDSFNTKIKKDLMKKAINNANGQELENENLKLSEISKRYPYNALWAQLDELHGAMTNPAKLCRTIICGSDSSINLIEKCLNSMTYFIRSSEVRRNKHTKIFNKDEISKLVNLQLNSRKKSENLVETSPIVQVKRKSLSLGLSRTVSAVKDLSFMADENNSENVKNMSDNDNDEELSEQYEIFRKNVMNDVPKVLAFRDSRFVKQELRIGNKSMDTGIVMNDKDRAYYLNNYKKKNDRDHEHNIKLLVTSPESTTSIPLNLNDDDHQCGEKYFHILSDTKNLIEDLSCKCNFQSLKPPCHEKIIEENEPQNNTCSERVEFVLGGENEKLVGIAPQGTADQKRFLDHSPEYSRRSVLNPRSLMDVPCDHSAMDSSLLKIIVLPLLHSVQSVNIQDEIFKPGFTSSLFSSINDHYIADMILQGVATLPSDWEHQLKRDLMISSQTAVHNEQMQMENIAIIANVDKFEVRIVSSHAPAIPPNSNNAGIGIVGMSNLIGLMLETVQALTASGATAPVCLSYIENKLKEIYFLSEALASLLLETEFATLNMLATTLSISINDIPLLMSVASIHTPSIAKKYGISFR